MIAGLEPDCLDSHPGSNTAKLNVAEKTSVRPLRDTVVRAGQVYTGGATPWAVPSVTAWSFSSSLAVAPHVSDLEARAPWAQSVGFPLLCLLPAEAVSSHFFCGTYMLNHLVCPPRLASLLAGSPSLLEGLPDISMGIHVRQDQMMVTEQADEPWGFVHWCLLPRSAGFPTNKFTVSHAQNWISISSPVPHACPCRGPS